MPVPAFTWAAKLTAAVACMVAIAWLVKLRTLGRTQAPPVVSFWFGVFFFGGGASAAIGAVLEAAFDDLQDGPAWIAMLIALEIAASGNCNRPPLPSSPYIPDNTRVELN